MTHEEANMPDQHIHSVSVAGVVVDDAGRVLVIKRRDNGRWEAPGGILERDEAFEEGVVREVVEETGVTVEVERLTGVYKNMTRSIVALVYRCRPLVGSASATGESAAVAWITPEQVAERMLPAYAIRIMDALGDKPASRAHDGAQVIPATPIPARG
jgi:8-oxo-dGTP diphosphatase